MSDEEKKLQVRYYESEITDYETAIAEMNGELKKHRDFVTCTELAIARLVKHRDCALAEIGKLKAELNPPEREIFGWKELTTEEIYTILSKKSQAPVGIPFAGAVGGSP